MPGIASGFVGAPGSAGVPETGPCSSHCCCALAAAASIARVFKVASSGRSEAWRAGDTPAAASGLAGFITALRQIDTAGGPHPGQHNSFRGVPLKARDAATRAAISILGGLFDAAALTAAWDAALQAPEWHDPPVWIHGDLQSGNLLALNGRLSAVIDFGCLGVGDPACDLIVAWNLLCAETRGAFRAELQIDDASWARGRGWALSVGLIALPYYGATNPVLAGISRYAINEVLSAHKRAI